MQMTATRAHEPFGLHRAVVVIDDDPAVRHSLKFALEIEGLTAQSFANGAEFLNAMNLLLCDCLVVDQRMPGISGLDLIEQLRSRHNSTPAILITSNPSATLRAQAEKAEVPIVEKPLLGSGLLDEIRSVIGDGPR